MGTKLEQLDRFFTTPRTTGELKQLTRQLLDNTQDARTIERIWCCANFFAMYGAAGEEGKTVLADTGVQLMAALLD